MGCFCAHANVLPATAQKGHVSEWASGEEEEEERKCVCVCVCVWHALHLVLRNLEEAIAEVGHVRGEWVLRDDKDARAVAWFKFCE